MPDYHDPETGLITDNEEVARELGMVPLQGPAPAGAMRAVGFVSPEQASGMRPVATPAAPSSPVMPPGQGMVPGPNGPESIDQLMARLSAEQGTGMSAPPDTTGLHPVVRQAVERRFMNSMGMDWKSDPGQAYRPAGFVPLRLEGAIEEAPGQFEERQGLAERARGLSRDGRDIQLEENQLARDYQDAREAEARDQMNRQHVRVQEIEGGVRGEMMDLTNQMDRHRKLIDKGVDPWRAFGDGVSGKIAAALSLMTTSLAGGEHADRGMQLFNRIIDREVDRQKYEIETQGQQVDNAYGRLRDQLGDRDQAEAAFRALMLATAEHEMKSMLLKTADPRTVQAANEQILAIDEALQQANDAYHVRSIGKLTEAYDQGQAARAGSSGWRPMALKDWESNLESKAGVASTEAGTIERYNKMAQTGAPGATLDIKGKEKALTERRAAVRGLALLDRLSKARGEEGLDYDTGDYIGEKRGTFTDKVPGRGLLDTMRAGIPMEQNEDATNYDRDVAQAKSEFRLAITGQAGAEAELARIERQVDSPLEHQHLAGMRALAHGLLFRKKAAEADLGKDAVNWLEQRRQEEFGKDAPPPGAFGDKPYD